MYLFVYLSWDRNFTKIFLIEHSTIIIIIFRILKNTKIHKNNNYDTYCDIYPLNGIRKTLKKFTFFIGSY